MRSVIFWLLVIVFDAWWNDGIFLLFVFVFAFAFIHFAYERETIFTEIVRILMLMMLTDCWHKNDRNKIRNKRKKELLFCHVNGGGRKRRKKKLRVEIFSMVISKHKRGRQTLYTIYLYIFADSDGRLWLGVKKIHFGRNAEELIRANLVQRKLQFQWTGTGQKSQ